SWRRSTATLVNCNALLALATATPPTSSWKWPVRKRTWPSHRPLPELEHRLGDLADRGSGDRGGGLLEDEQPCPGDLARDRLAVADGEEPVAAAVDDERGDLDLGQPLAPPGFTVEPGKHHAQLIGHLDRRCGAGRAVPNARSDHARGDRVVAEDLGARS